MVINWENLRVADFSRDVCVDMSLTTADFYKSMTTYADHTIWQDVYRPRTVHGSVYPKLTVTTTC